MWFSININALGNATRAQKHNLFYLPSDPSHIYQSIQIDSTVYGPDLPEFVSLSPPKKLALLQNIRNVQELTFWGENNC